MTARSVILEIVLFAYVMVALVTLYAGGVQNGRCGGFPNYGEAFFMAVLWPAWVPIVMMLPDPPAEFSNGECKP